MNDEVSRLEEEVKRLREWLVQIEMGWNFDQFEGPNWQSNEAKIIDGTYRRMARAALCGEKP